MAADKLPAIHLYPGDWLRDAVSGCSLAAQGLWLRMMFFAHDSPKYGQMFARDLLGSKMRIARHCGATIEEFDALFSELLEAGVPEIEGEIVFSRRMVRDASLRAVRAKAGSKGGKQTAKQKSSKRSSKRGIKTQANTEDEDENEDDIENGFEEFWKVVPRKEGKGAAETAYAKAAARIAGRSGPGGDDPDAFLLERMKAFAQTPRGRAGKHCPHPATWLNQARYDDDPAAWQLGGPENDHRGVKSAAAEYLGFSDG